MPKDLSKVGDRMCYPRDWYEVDRLFLMDPFVALTWLQRIDPKLLNYPIDQMMEAPQGPLMWYTNKLAVVVSMSYHLDSDVFYCIYAHDGDFYMISCSPKPKRNS